MATPAEFPRTAIRRVVLSSWKEVAAHLKVDVRTAQRWQKKTDIPIHHQPCDRRGHPFAYIDELDAWLERRARGTVLPPGAEPDTATSPSRLATEATSVARLPRGWPRASAAVVACIVAAGAWGVLAWNRPDAPARVEIDGHTLTVFDAHGRICWRRDVPDLSGVQALRTTTSFAAEESLVTDVDGDGRADVLVNAPARTEGAVPARLLAFDSRGQPLWTFAYGRQLTWRDRSFSQHYAARLLRRVRGAGGDFVLAIAWHSLWFPAQVALLEPRTGRLVDEYWHPGALHFVAQHDIDGDAQDELIMAGVNNPGPGLGHAALVALEVPFSLAPRKYAGGMSEFTGGRELTYVAFPRPDVCSAEGRIPFVTGLSIEDRDRIVVRIHCGDTSFFHTLRADLLAERQPFLRQLVRPPQEARKTGPGHPRAHHRRAAVSSKRCCLPHRPGRERCRPRQALEGVRRTLNGAAQARKLRSCLRGRPRGAQNLSEPLPRSHRVGYARDIVRATGDRDRKIHRIRDGHESRPASRLMPRPIAC